MKRIKFTTFMMPLTKRSFYLQCVVRLFGAEVSLPHFAQEKILRRTRTSLISLETPAGIKVAYFTSHLLFLFLFFSPNFQIKIKIVIPYQLVRG